MTWKEFLHTLNEAAKEEGIKDDDEVIFATEQSNLTLLSIYRIEYCVHTRTEQHQQYAAVYLDIGKLTGD
jgi:hypothetical protein